MNLLLFTALDLFLAAVEARGGRSRTVGTYRQRLCPMLRYLETRGVVAAEVVSAADLDAWVVSMRRQSRRWADHSSRPVVDGGLSDATIAGRVQSCKAFFKFLVDRGYLERSPAAHLRKPRVELSARDRVMDEADLLAMVAVAQAEAEAGRPRDLALLTFLYESGCRAGEAAKLRVGDLDLELCEAFIRDGKTGERWVDFADAACRALRAWMSVRPDVDHDYVFVSQRGGPLSSNSIYQALKRLADRAGVQGRFNPHAIRHLVGQTFTDEGNLALAQEKLGHRDITTTARFYAHQDRKRVRDATRRISVLNDSSDGAAD